MVHETVIEFGVWKCFHISQWYLLLRVMPFQLRKGFMETLFFQRACIYYAVIFQFVFAQSLETIGLPSVYMDLTLLEVSYKENPITL